MVLMGINVRWETSTVSGTERIKRLIAPSSFDTGGKAQLFSVDGTIRLVDRDATPFVTK